MIERRYALSELTHAMGDVLARMKTEGHTNLREFVDGTTEALKALPVAEDPIVAKARKVVEAVTFDDSGTMGRGGNGGLLSRETVQAVDALRVELLKQGT